MNKNKPINNQIFRDGVSQRDRLLKALEPDYVSVDERDLSDLLTFVQQYATKLNYYDESNTIKGDWSSFFAGDVQQMVAYINHPESFADDEQTLKQLSQPHLVLLFTFLLLLRYPQQQFKALTQRHLDFYYKDVLKLTERKEVSDKVHVIFELAQGEETHLIKQGTLLNAGQDSQGIDLNYATDNDIIVNQATVGSIKTVFVEKSYIDLETIHNQEKKSDTGFENMLRWAVGRPNQGDELPKFNGNAVDIEYLKTNIYQPIKALKTTDLVPDNIKKYIENQLFFDTVENFKYCLDVHDRQINKDEPDIQEPTELEWQEVYKIIEKAYKKKITFQRRNALKEEREKSGFESMMKFALGHPNPGDSLPEMPNNYKTLQQIFENITQEDVTRYIKEQLYLSVEDFRKIIEIQGTTENQNWEEVYRLVEKAQTKKRNFTYPPIGRTEIKNIYANSIIDVEDGKVAKLERFNTFGNPTKNSQNVIGFAVISPVLLLTEGERTITLTFASQEKTLNREAFQKIMESQNQPFEISLSGEKQWIKLEDFEYTIGDFIVEEPLKSYANNQISLNSDFTRVSLTNDTFSNSKDNNDVEKIIIWNDGRIFQIKKISTTNNREADIQQIGIGHFPKKETQETENQINLYRPSAIYLNSLQFQLTLNSNFYPIWPLIPDKSNFVIATPYPAVKILLKEVSSENNNQEKLLYYEQFKSVRLEKVNIQVKVEGVQDIKLRNDNSILSTKTPFQPFGNSPKAGSGFYFTNKEISQKKLDSLAIKIEWMGLPQDFRTHYQAYYSTGVIPNAIANNSFKASLKLFNNRSWVNIETEKPLFSQENNTLSNPIHLNYKNFNVPGYSLETSNVETDSDDPFEQSRYFKLELESPDFGQDLYPIVLNKVALATDDKRNLTVYPPYTPEVKAISLDYTASVEIDLKDPSNKHLSQIFQLHPFGYVDIQTLNQYNSTDKQYYLLPQYEEEGSLYIGIRNLQPPQNLSILFQMIGGSGNGELTQPQVHWSYLSGNSWQIFQETEIISDSTNGLLDAGIIRLSIPNKATSQHHLLPGGLHWIRATVKENIDAISDTLDIKPQAVSATFVNQENAADHFSKPLAADSIKGFVTRNPAIKTVQQFYTSFGGKPKEDNRTFTMRVSERLRHKQRAITAWDYERLVLEKFLQIYKVKCITSAAGNDNPSAAKVTVVVIPDISNTAPFFPLEPKAPLYLLKEIEAYLQKYTSPFVKIIVKNPNYERIKYRVGIRFRGGYEQGYYLNQLNQDIKRFLSPWAYEEQADIPFGSSIHSSSVIHFIEKRPYVDYVANLKLIEQVGIKTGSQGKSDTSYRVNQSNLAQVQHPDSILVSASEHIIDLIGTENYDKEDFEGIGYMIIGIDFFVS